MTKNRIFPKMVKMIFFFEFCHFFVKSIKNNGFWPTLTVLGSILRKILKKAFFRKKASKTSELENSNRGKKNFFPENIWNQRGKIVKKKFFGKKNFLPKKRLFQIFTFFGIFFPHIFHYLETKIAQEWFFSYKC